MNNALRIFSFLFFSASAFYSVGQDRITLMNGTTVEAEVIGASTLEIRYQFVKKNGKMKLDAFPTDRVFSIMDSTGKETVWYFQDMMMGNDMSVDEMRWFIKGQQDARKGYRSPWATWGGFALSAGLIIGLDLEVNSFFIPPLWTAVVVLPRVNITRGSIRDPMMEGNDVYAYGYASAARGKRVFRGLIGSFAGVAVGLLTRQVINNNQ